jgi:hypothetical protein
MCAESGSVSQDTVTHWTNETSGLIQGYEGTNISIADETLFLYPLMPDNSQLLKDGTWQGGNKSKEHLMVLLCSSADGSEKLKPLVIGKFAKPQPQNLIHH